MFAFKICITLSAALTGTVLFSTTILLLFEQSAINRAQLSTCFKSAARPFPLPLVLGGVLTEMKTRSASSTCFLTSEEKNKFLPRQFFTTSSKPGWKKLRLDGFTLRPYRFSPRRLEAYLNSTVWFSLRSYQQRWQSNQDTSKLWRSKSDLQRILRNAKSLSGNSRDSTNHSPAPKQHTFEICWCGASPFW